MTLIELLEEINLDHLLNGYNMWPEWWEQSTPSWQLGFKIREYHEKHYKRQSQQT